MFKTIKSFLKNIFLPDTIFDNSILGIQKLIFEVENILYQTSLDYHYKNNYNKICSMYSDLICCLEKQIEQYNYVDLECRKSIHLKLLNEFKQIEKQLNYIKSSGFRSNVILTVKFVQLDITQKIVVLDKPYLIKMNEMLDCIVTSRKIIQKCFNKRIAF